MRSIRSSRSALAAALLLCGSAAYAVPAGNGIMQGKGFDACTAPSISTMQKWWTNTPWSWIGIYIGGSVRACSQPNLTANWMNKTYAQGWRYELIWVGPQAPCTSYRHRISYNKTTAYQQGKAEAISAYKALQALGFGTAKGTPVTYDMEAYPNNSSCRAAVKSFMQGWVDQLAVAPAQVAGVYGSGCGTYLSDFATMARPPRFINAADWDRDPSTWHLSCISGGHWTHNQRFKQYRGDHNETWGGVTLNIDSNCANGPTAAGGHLFPNSSCIAP
ncbi:DUF1906 domain-containing protein [Aquabacterium sp. A7-Y]|uniref:DUF1906 domain-containing protein n=1 Tax=Aquabacterium sp. A7-Y TaxID=1349605 RepID=UPI00223DB41C|nr:DUF1906 domain-containing protein [Aquabacterium sp. A7-Y]MCW7539485.1 DUF1906 domain-containing protein [Aquabacterium sp. A7-Y]